MDRPIGFQAWEAPHDSSDSKGVGLLVREPAFEFIELPECKGDSEWVGPVLEPQARESVLVEIIRRVHFLKGTSVEVSEELRPIVNASVAGQHDSAFSSSDDLLGANAPGRGIPIRAYEATVESCTVRMRAVLQQEEGMFISELSSSFEIDGQAPHVSDDQPACSPRQASSCHLQVDRAIRQAVDQHRERAELKERCRGRKERVRRAEDFVAGSNLEPEVAGMKGGRS